LKPNRCEIFIYWLGFIQFKSFIDQRLDVDDIKRSNFVNLIEENLGIRWHLEVEARHKHNQLLSVDHAP
jgi:hypothetical protein